MRKIFRKSEKSDVNKSLKEYRDGFFILFVLFIILSIIFFSFIGSIDSIDGYKNPEIILKDSLTGSQIELIEEMINDLKLIYFRSAKSFTFTANSSEITNRLSPFREGYVDVYNNVYLHFTNNLEFNRQALCHEIAHTFLKGSIRAGMYEETIEEDYAYDLMTTKFCFNDNTKSKCSTGEFTTENQVNGFYYDDCLMFKESWNNDG